MMAMTCSRVTPAFTVRMTITPVVVGEKAWAWATDELAMEVAPVRVKVAKTTLRSAFIVPVSATMAGSLVLGSPHRRDPDLQVRHTAASRVRLFAIMLMGYEAELHSQAGRARRCGGVPERCPAPEFSPGGRGARGDAIGDQSGDTRTRGARRCTALHPHDPQCRPDRSRRAIPFARKARLRGAHRRKRRRQGRLPARAQER